VSWFAASQRPCSGSEAVTFVARTARRTSARWWEGTRHSIVTQQFSVTQPPREPSSLVLVDVYLRAVTVGIAFGWNCVAYALLLTGKAWTRQLDARQTAWEGSEQCCKVGKVEVEQPLTPRFDLDHERAPMSGSGTTKLRSRLRRVADYACQDAAAVHTLVRPAGGIGSLQCRLHHSYGKPNDLNRLHTQKPATRPDGPGSHQRDRHQPDQCGQPAYAASVRTRLFAVGAFRSALYLDADWESRIAQHDAERLSTQLPFSVPAWLMETIRL
jgi:hypothetical protein